MLNLKQNFKNFLLNIVYRKLKAIDFSLMSNDCFGGCYLHNLGIRFQSPTVNTLASFQSFLMLCFLRDKLSSAKIEYEYIVLWGKPNIPKLNLYVDDKIIEIVFPHALNAEQALEEWNKRVNRTLKQVAFVYVCREHLTIDQLNSMSKYLGLDRTIIVGTKEDKKVYHKVIVHKTFSKNRHTPALWGDTDFKFQYKFSRCLLNVIKRKHISQ